MHPSTFFASMLAVSVIAAAFVAPPSRPTQLGGLRVLPAQSLSVARRSAPEMRAKGDNTIKFGKYQDKLTWKEVLDEDPKYCEWVLNKGPQTQPRFREFQRWLIKQAPQPRLLYHYTDSKAAKQIMGSGELKPSLKSAGDAFHGDGVYFTSLDPETTSYAELHENNYDGDVTEKSNY